jgi:hypothetical protein
MCSCSSAMTSVDAIPSQASLLSSFGRIADLCSEDGILLKCAGDTKTNDFITKKIGPIVQEVAAVEFVNQIGDQAQAQLEEDWNQKSEAVMATVMTQQKLGLGADLPTASLPSEAVSSTTVEVQTTTSPSKT